MNKQYELYLEDILHTGPHAPEGESKVGEKYDWQRNTYCRFVPENPSPGETVHIIHYFDSEDMESLLPAFNTYTTPFVSLTEDDDHVFLGTVNSIYKFRKDKGEEQ